MQVTKVKLQQKQAEGIAEARSGRRSPVSILLGRNSMTHLQLVPRKLAYMHL